MHRLLDWIDRCDWASQRKEPKPVFATSAGESIFPESDDQWWLTDTQRKNENKQMPPVDEDGPAEPDEECVEDIAEFTDDEDPPSSEVEAPHHEDDKKEYEFTKYTGVCENNDLLS